jgi:hypothetical protein
MTPPRSDIDTRMVGLTDKVADGFYNPGTGELRPGFPVTAQDVAIDVGCGGGMDSMFCAGQGAHVIYVDSNPDEVALAGTRLAGTGARELPQSSVTQIPCRLRTELRHALLRQRCWSMSTIRNDSWKNSSVSVRQMPCI